MFWRLSVAVLLLCLPSLAGAQACTHYASPSGTGSTCTIGTPCLINSFWSISSLPGKVLCLNNGTYTGANSMIRPPVPISGTSGNPITIRALNDGQVLLNAQNSGSPVSLSWVADGNENRWFVIEGINAANGEDEIVSVYGSDNIIRRVIAWNAASGNNSYGINIAGYRSVCEDCAAWGNNIRKVLNGSQAGNLQGSGFRRSWGEWNDHPLPPGNDPTNTYQVGYNTTNQIFENVLGTWNATGDTLEPEGVMGMFLNNSGGNVSVGNTQVLGSILYVRPGSSYTPNQVVYGFNISDVLLRDVVAYVAPGYTTKSPFTFVSCDVSTCSNNVCDNCLSVHAGTPLINEAGSGWSTPNLHQGNGLAAATGGTSAFTLLPGICTRYVNGTLTATPLWPWPMDARISAARVASGFADVTVTAQIEALLGTIPAACRSDAGVVFLGNPTGLGISGNATVLFLGDPTGLGASGNSTVPFLGNPTGLGASGNATPTFLGNPTGLNVTAP